LSHSKIAHQNHAAAPAKVDLRARAASAAQVQKRREVLRLLPVQNFFLFALFCACLPQAGAMYSVIDFATDFSLQERAASLRLARKNHTVVFVVPPSMDNFPAPKEVSISNPPMIARFFRK
jgi:hypothetical protein